MLTNIRLILCELAYRFNIYKRLLLLLLLQFIYVIAHPQDTAHINYLDKYAYPALKNCSSCYYYLEFWENSSDAIKAARSQAVRQLDARSFIVEKNKFSSLASKNNYKHFLPANNLWKLSPTAETLKQLNKAEDEFLFTIGYTSEVALNLLLDMHPGLVKHVSFLRGQHIISCLSSYQKICDAFLDNPAIVAIDVQTSKPKEELALPGFDFSVNQINVVHAAYPRINGSGQYVSVKEQSYDTTDIDLRGRCIISPTASPDISTHANFIATLIAGGGNSAYYARGVAWGAGISSTSFDIILPEENSYYVENNISVQNHSYGSEIDNTYGLNAAAFDKSMNDNTGLLHVFSAGNSGTGGSTSGRYAGIEGCANLTGNYKMAKNVLVVGAEDSFGIVAGLSSRGPAYDGRLKPDVVAFQKNGTSESAAIVSGISLMLQQYFRNRNDSALPSALARAILINTADDVYSPGPDYATGYGSVNAVKAIQSIAGNTMFSGSIAQGGTGMFDISVPANASKLKVTLAWNDVAGTPFAPRALVNDLDLQVSVVGLNTTWKPWVLSSFPAKDSLTALPLRKRDSLNTIEQITIDLPSPGTYRINVSGYNVPQGAQEYFVVYGYDTVKSFGWQFPAAVDFMEAGKEGVLRWQSNLPGKGEIQYKNVLTGTWIPVAGNIDLSTKFFKWAVPDTPGPCVLRMKAGGAFFYSDTFPVTSFVTPLTGFACPDSILLFWNGLQGIDQYQVYELGEKYMEPLIKISDTSVVLPANTFGSKYFAVAPVFHNGTPGVKSFGFDYTLQGTGCYIKAFTAEAEGENAQLLLSLGSAYGVREVSFEKLLSSGLNTVYDTLVNNRLNFFFNFKPLEEGINIFRAKVTLESGRVIYSDDVQVYYAQKGRFLVFPVPVRRNTDIHVFTSAPDGEVIQLTDVMGRTVVRQAILSPHEYIKTSRLQPGQYFYRIFHGSLKAGSGRLLIL